MILQYNPTVTQKEKKTLNNYLKKNFWLTENHLNKKFEQLFSKLIGVKYSVTFPNGTLTMTAIAYCLGLKANDEVIVPNISMIATANAFKILGCKIKFCDIEASSKYLSLDNLKKKITSKTKCIVLVNYNGNNPSYDIRDLITLCKNRKIHLIEDSAHSFLSYYKKNLHHGSVGIASSFSFSPAKLITSGQGGAVCTSNKNMYLKLKKFKDFGRLKGGNDIHNFFGLNLKFTDIQSALLLGQLKNIKYKSLKKKIIYSLYNKHLSTNRVVLTKFDTRVNTPWFIEIKVMNNREKLINFLKSKNIQTRKVYPPLNKQKIYLDKNKKNKLSISIEYSNRSLWLPSSLDLNENKIKKISNFINNFYDK